MDEGTRDSSKKPRRSREGKRVPRRLTKKKDSTKNAFRSAQSNEADKVNGTEGSGRRPLHDSKSEDGRDGV